MEAPEIERSVSPLGEVRPQADAPVEVGGEVLVETYFQDGSLGVTLRRHADSGIVFVFDIIPESQATTIDVQPGDELWSVGDFDIGRTPLDKEAWKHLIGYIKESVRPLRMVWLRRPQALPEAPQEDTVGIAEPAPAAVSAEFVELEKLVSRLTFKDNTWKPSSLLPVAMASNKKNAAADAAPSILQMGRRILRQGDLMVSAKGSKWAKPANKRFVLLNDLIVISSPQPGNTFNVEYIIELPTSKIRSLGQVFGGDHSSADHAGASSVALDATFELLWPGGELQVIADSKEIKEVWVLNIYLAICECVGHENRVLGWRHQYMLGTVHAAVLSRDENRIKELVSYCEAGMLDYLAIDTADEDGYTPLHYACMLRIHNIMKILHEATADVTAADNHGFSALHWSAMQLDDVALEMLCSHVFDIDLMDRQGRSPLVLACIEGRNYTGKLDPQKLRHCVEIMLTHKPDVNYVNSIGETLAHLLAGSWQYGALELIVGGGVNDINALEVTYGMTPLHYAVLGDLTNAPIGEAARIMDLPPVRSAEDNANDPSSIDGVEALRVLLKAGARMNIKDNLGRSALALLLDPAQVAKWNEDTEAGIAMLVSFGCRPDESNVAVVKSLYPDFNLAAHQDKWTNLPPLDCARLDIKINQYEPLHDLSADESTSALSTKSNEAGKAGARCMLCAVPFTLFRRTHHCRLCNVLCCDDCSRKRCIIDNAQVRACDCCFNRVLTAEEKFKTAQMISSIQPLNAARSASTAEPPAGATEKEKKESLFGFAFSSPDKKAAEPVKPTQQAQGSTNAAMGAMSEAHERLQERGEKLSRVSDKTDELANQAGEFARLARQLNEQQKSRWF